MRECPHCRSGVVRTKKDQARLVSGTCFVVRTAALTCKSCRAVFMAGESLERVDLAIGATLALTGPVSGDSFRFMRKALGLRGSELASLLSVTGETVSRWENGQRPVDLMAWILVGGLVLERGGRPTATAERLQSAKTPAALPKTVRLDITERSATRAGAARVSRPRVSRVA